MFKRLRNSYLITNSIIIAALLFLCFGSIYAMVYRNTVLNTQRRLDREISICENGGIEGGKFGEGDRKPPMDGEKKGKPGDPYMQPFADGAFMPAFSVKCDSDGNITKVNMNMFTADNDFYKELVPKLTASGKAEGTAKYTTTSGDVNIWQYRLKKTGDGYIAAFVEVSRELAFLRALLLILLLTMLVATFGAVMISWFFANRSIKPIEEAYNKQKQFIADASHELKTPLAAINTNLDVLLSNGGFDDGDDKKWLVYIKDETKRMAKLTEELLYLARTENTEEGTVYSKISWTDAVKNAVMLMEARAFENGLTAVTNIEEDVFTAASEDKLRQLSIILIDNAIKYTPRGGEIIITLAKKGNDAVLSVKNTGIGISEEELLHLFDRFYRADKSRTNGENFGYGLGLPIAKAIVRALNGHISAASDGETYTEFTVKLPILK